MLAGGSLKEEGVECIVMLLGALLLPDLAVGSDVVLQAVQLPARVSDLHSALPQVDRDALPLFRNEARTLWMINMDEAGNKTRCKDSVLRQ